MFITSKLWNNFHRPERVKQGLQESLAKLRLSYLDLFLVHFPVSFRPDVTEATSPDEVENVPLEDTWRAMEALVDEGLVKNIVHKQTCSFYLCVAFGFCIWFYNC